MEYFDEFEINEGIIPVFMSLIIFCVVVFFFDQKRKRKVIRGEKVANQY